MKYDTAFPYFPEGDRREILDRFDEILSGNGFLTMGKYVKNFEKDFSHYIGVKHAIATNSCTSALEVVLKTIDAGEGDEVIIPAQTFIATGSSVCMNGAKIVFCETDGNFLLDFEDLKKKITSRTKAVMIVHFAGLIHPEIFEIKDYLQGKNIYLIEDAAHAPGSRIGEIYAGSIGDFGCFSFYSTKIMTTGEGGMITTNNEKFYERCSSLRDRGINVNSDTEIFINLGSNRRMTEFQGLLGIYQLKRLEEFVEHRNKIADVYRKTLRPLEKQGLIGFQRYPSNVRHAYWRFLVFLKNSSMSRELLKRDMEKFDIGIDWPYDPLLHLQPIFKKIYGINEGFLRKTEKLSKKHFCLPIHVKINENIAEFIGNKVREAIE